MAAAAYTSFLRGWVGIPRRRLGWPAAAACVRGAPAMPRQHLLSVRSTRAGTVSASGEGEFDGGGERLGSTGTVVPAIVDGVVHNAGDGTKHKFPAKKKA